MKDVMTDKLFKFLLRHYPVNRVKLNGRFKRAIVLDGGDTFFLSQKERHFLLKKRLGEILVSVFYLDKNYIDTIIDDYLHNN